MDELRYRYVLRKEMQSVLDITDFPENERAEIAYERFVHKNNDVLYIEENGVLMGVVSIGDLERYYANKMDRLEINHHFSYADWIDEEKAAKFFEGYATFFEFPVVGREGCLEGVLKRDMRHDIRMDQIASLVVSRYLGEQWHKRELNRFLDGTKARRVLYYIDEQAIVKALADRSGSENGKTIEEPYWKGLSKRQWDYFLGEMDAAPRLKEEFGNFHTKMVKGVSEVVDMEGEFYNCRGGNRITHGNPQASEGRIIFYGPCTIAGAYCKDRHTIESCFQRLLNRRLESSALVINKGLFNMFNFFSRMMTDELSGKDIAFIFVEKSWLTDEMRHKCEYMGDLTDTFLEVEDLERNIIDKADHCNYRVNERLAERIYHDFEVHGLFDVADFPNETTHIQDYYIGSEIMSEVLLYMERNGLLSWNDGGTKGAMALLADPFMAQHRAAVERALKKVDRLFLFVAEDSNLKYSLEERIQSVRKAVSDLEKVVVVPAGKYLYTKKVSRGIRKKRFCNDDMEFECDIFGEIFGKIMGIQYRFVMSESGNPVEEKYMDTCFQILPQFGLEVEKL